MQYSDKDLEALISEVETEFEAHLNKSEGTEVVETTVSTEAAAQEEETQELAKSEDEETFNYDEDDMKEMNELYASMSKSEKEAHYKAVKSVLFGEEESEEDAQIAKSEKSSEEAEAKEETAEPELLAKHEELVKENEELKKSVSKLVTLLTEKVQKGAAPKQKAITEIQYMKKSEDDVIASNENEVDVEKLSKAEIAVKLKEKARTEDLKKSDRERINAYMFNEIGIDKIKDLL